MVNGLYLMPNFPAIATTVLITIFNLGIVTNRPEQGLTLFLCFC